MRGSLKRIHLRSKMSKNLRSNRGTAKFSHLQLRNNGESGKINVSPCQGISKYLTRASSSQQKPPELSSPFLNKTKEIVPNLKNDDDDDDFKPVKPIKIARIFTNPKTNSKVSRKKYTKKAKTKKGDNLIQKTLRENFGQDDVNPEHLQIALALSKSVQDQAGSQEDNSDVPIYPSTQEIKENARGTLAQFAFKSGKSEDIIWPLKSYTEVVRKKKKSKFSCVTPILLLRTNEERDSLISSKISSILANNILHTSTDCCVTESLNVFSNMLEKYHCRESKLFQMSNLSTCDTNDLFYVQKLNFEPDTTKCGGLLKKWEEIPGRALSPPRSYKKTVQNIEAIFGDNISKTLQNMVDYSINDQPTEIIVEQSICNSEDNASPIPDFELISPKHIHISPEKNDYVEKEKSIVNEKKSCNRSISPDLFDSDEARFESPIIQKFKRSIPNSFDISEELKSDDDDCDILDNGVCYFESFCEDEALISQKCLDNFTSKDKKSPIIDDGGKIQNTSIDTFDLTQEETIILEHNSKELEVKTRQSWSMKNKSLFKEESFLLESNLNRVDDKQCQHLQKHNLPEEETTVLEDYNIKNDSKNKLDLKCNTNISELETLKSEDFAKEKTVLMSNFIDYDEMHTMSLNKTQTLTNEHLESKHEIYKTIKNYNFIALEEDFLNCNSTIVDFAGKSKHSECIEIENDSIDKLDLTEEVLKCNTKISELETLKTEDYDFAKEKTVLASNFIESDKMHTTIIVDKQNESLNKTQTLTNELLETQHGSCKSIKNYNFIALEEDFLKCNSTINDFAGNSKHSQYKETEENSDVMKQADNMKSKKDDSLNLTKLINYLRHDKKTDVIDLCHDSNDSNDSESLKYFSNTISKFKFEAQSKSKIAEDEKSCNEVDEENDLINNKKIDEEEISTEELIKSLDDTINKFKRNSSINSNDSSASQESCAISDEELNYSSYFHTPKKLKAKYNQFELVDDNDIIEIDDSDDDGVASLTTPTKEYISKVNINDVDTEYMICDDNGVVNDFDAIATPTITNDIVSTPSICLTTPIKENISKVNIIGIDTEYVICDDNGVVNDLDAIATPTITNDIVATPSNCLTTPIKENVSKVNINDMYTEYMICDGNVSGSLDNNSLRRKVIHPRVRDLSSRKSYGFNDTFGNLLEQSKFIKQIENRLDTVNEKTPVKENPIEVQTTPENGMIIKTTDITPMPDYESMKSPEIVQELNKFGVKKLKRHRGISMLKYLYESTHPKSYEEPEPDQIEEERSAKRRRKLIVEDEFKTKEPEAIEILADVNAGESIEDMIFEKKISKKIASCQVPIHIAFHNLVTSDPNLQENILLYEPLQVEVLYDMLKEQGYKYHLQDLITFLDRKCITFRLNQANK